jgi:TolB-like protein
MSETLGHYRILDRIGAGPIGEVYRARDTRLGRTVAVVEVAASITDAPDRRQRFFDAARATLVLSHPNIAALYEVDDDQGQLYLVREFVSGQTLATEMAGRAMNPRRALELAVQIADALADAHAAGVVHGGITPDKIVITPKGNAKVFDFGLARWADGAAAAAYMSPEQINGQALDHRTDIFSLGIVLSEMLTGKLPVDVRAARSTTGEHAPTPVLGSQNRSLPAGLDSIFTKMIATAPDHRYASAAELSADLRAVAATLDARSAASEPTVVVAVRKPPGRVHSSRAIGVAIVALLIATAWWQRAALEGIWRHTVGSPPAARIVVLPFDTDQDQTSFADGVADDLVARLGQTPGLTVLGRSGIRQDRGRSPVDVARELNAPVVLTGSVHRQTDAVEVIVHLIDPRDNSVLWTGKYTRDVANVFAVQAQIAEGVAQALHVKLEPTASSARAASRLVDRRGYETYLRARQAAAARNLHDAEQLYEAAVQLDDGLAEAYGGLAEALALEPTIGSADDPSRRSRLKRAAERAFELAPDSPQSNLALALAADHLADRLNYLKKAIAIDASYADAYQQIADQIADFDPDRAMAFYRRALAFDPRMTASRAHVVTTLAISGRAEEAKRELDAPEGTVVSGWAAPVQVACALDARRFSDALTLLNRDNLYRRSRALTLQYADVLRETGRAADAYTVAAELADGDEHDCEAKATLAALKFERQDGAAARKLVAPALQARSASDIGPVAIRCGLHSAAALGDVPAAAAWLRRVADDERLFREWSLNIVGITGRGVLRAPIYPWSRVAAAPAVLDAVRALDRVYAAARQVSIDVLSDVTPAAGGL